MKVVDCEAILKRAIEAVAPVVKQLVATNGCNTATIEAAHQDKRHKLFKRLDQFSGVFLPEYQAVTDKDTQVDMIHPTGLHHIEHWSIGCKCNGIAWLTNQTEVLFISKISMNVYYCYAERKTFIVGTKDIRSLTHTGVGQKENTG